MSKFFASLFPLFFVHTFALEVDVVAEKISKSKSDVTSSVNYYSSEDIQNSNESSLTNFLQSRAGLQMGSTGAIGQATSTYIRGAKSEYMLVIVDGLELNDPSSIGAQFEIQHIDLKSIQSIEVLKGSQTVLYGADALSGVLKITTKDPLKNRSQVFAGFGSYATKKMGGMSAGSRGSLRYSFNASTLRSDSVSAYRNGAQLEKDSYKQNNINMKISHVAPKAKASLVLKTISSDAEIDENNKDVVGKDLSSFKQWAQAFIYEFQSFEIIKSKIQLSEVRTERTYELYSLEYEGLKQKVEFENEFNFNNHWKSMIGADFERNKVSASGSYNGKKENERSVYLFNYLKHGSFFSDQGFRLTSGIAESNKITSKFGLGYHLPLEMTLKASYATAFKAATLDELYSPYGGNKSLRPTKSESVDVTFSKKLGAGHVEVTYFNTNYRDQIVYTSAYENRDRTKTSGFEVDFDHYFNGVYRFLASYTHLRAVDKGNGKYLARRARHLANAGFEYLGLENKLVGLRTKYVGKRNETDGTLLKEYMLVDFYSSLEIDNGITFRLSLNNLFDKSYEQIRGYSTLGRNFLITGECEF